MAIGEQLGRHNVTEKLIRPSRRRLWPNAAEFGATLEVGRLKGVEFRDPPMAFSFHRGVCVDAWLLVLDHVADAVSHASMRVAANRNGPNLPELLWVDGYRAALLQLGPESAAFAPNWSVSGRSWQHRVEVAADLVGATVEQFFCNCGCPRILARFAMGIRFGWPLGRRALDESPRLNPWPSRHLWEV